MIFNTCRDLSADRTGTGRSVCLAKLANSGYKRAQNLFIEEMVDEIHLGSSVPACSVDLAIKRGVCDIVRSFPNVGKLCITLRSTLPIV